MIPYRNHQPARPTPRWLTIVQTVFVAATMAALTIALTLELAK